MAKHNSIRRAVASLAAAGFPFVATAAWAQMEETTAALPVVSLTFSAHYVAEDLGLWERAGLKMKTTIVTGMGAANAVLAGSVDFSNGSGPTVVRANARGQKLFAIGITIDKPMLEVVLHKDRAAQLGITDQTPVEKKAQLLKGLQLAIDAPNTIPHGYLRYFLSKGKLSDVRDVTLSPMAPPAMIAALKSGAVAGFVMSQPWTLIPVHEGVAVRLVSNPRGDFPELNPFAYNLILTRADLCDNKPSVCRKLLAGYQQAHAIIRDKPKEALAVLSKRFAKMDPRVVADAFEWTRKATPATVEITDIGLKHSQDLMLSTGMIKPEETLKSFSGIYTNKYRP